ncbi:MAG TPA: UDP-2,3-diacylglucosamine diphosphatase [Candidatus Saccharimonadales bacterium]|jgi:UDP-2,3-diacylglucosamine pyrophosphatase LpxH|nr:UDP-2,3-diacylglucosamine diphosphatase [Candidatus Saccharimonadales bacterium]
MKCATVDTLVLSDLHLGAEISRARDALDLIRSLQFRRLILLGDIFADLNFRRLTKAHWQFLGHIRKLSNPKRDTQVIWVEGNHDQGLADVMSHLVGVPVYRQFVWEFQGKRHIAIHGHQFDRFAVNNKFISRLGEWVFHEMQRLDHKNKRFVRYLDRLNTRWLRLSAKVAHGALSYAKQGKAERIFCGHTHVAEQRAQDGIEYFNSGGWIDRQCTYITIDEEGVKIHEYSGLTDDCYTGEEREPAAAEVIEFPVPAGLSPDVEYDGVPYESVPC